MVTSTFEPLRYKGTKQTQRFHLYLSRNMWTHKTTAAVGGLENVGFVPGQDFLIVLSANGEGIFNCLTGERVARNHNNYYWNERFNDETMTVKGFGLFADIEIQTSGLHGSDRLNKESQGWLLCKEKHEIILVSPDQSRVVVAPDDVCELRAFGFSDTGNSFVFASSCELIIYSGAELQFNAQRQ